MQCVNDYTHFSDGDGNDYFYYRPHSLSNAGATRSARYGDWPVDHVESVESGKAFHYSSRP